MKITLNKVKALYPEGKIVCVEEYYTKDKRWTSRLSDGTDVRDPDLYYRYGLNYVIAQCIREQATDIQFKVLDSEGEYCYPDFKVSELDEDNQ